MADCTPARPPPQPGGLPRTLINAMISHHLDPTGQRSPQGVRSELRLVGPAPAESHGRIQPRHYRRRSLVAAWSTSFHTHLMPGVYTERPCTGSCHTIELEVK